jgi:hypothetical protein
VQKPTVISRAEPEAAVAPPAAARHEPPPPAAVAPKKPPPAAVQKKAPLPAVAAVAPPAPAGENGFVAVLASVPVSANSRVDALKRFADLQQKYGGVLQNKTPDVREANLGEKGVYHRLLVGPPSSREQASALCGELKTAGYPSCWITAY